MKYPFQISNGGFIISDFNRRIEVTHRNDIRPDMETVWCVDCAEGYGEDTNLYDAMLKAKIAPDWAEHVLICLGLAQHVDKTPFMPMELFE